MESYDFKTEISVNILGHIFEQSLADLEMLTAGKNTKRKEDGVYYTPKYITEYVCKNTIIPYLSKSGTLSDADELVKEYSNNITELETKFKDITICDPSCGSGAFLIQAVDVMLEIDMCIREYKESQNNAMLDKWSTQYETEQIIENNIYGTDINHEAVEIARLAMFFRLATDKAKLPELQENIRVANSVIRSEFSSGEKFKNNMKKGGFSIIIGNPPYVRQELLKNKEKIQLPEASRLKKYEIPSKMDLSGYFFFHGLDILKDDGMLGFIASDSWLSFGYGRDLQKLLLEESKINILLKTEFNVFKDADVKTITTIIRKEHNNENTIKLFYVNIEDKILNPGLSYIELQQKEMEPSNWNNYFHQNDFAPQIPMVKMSDVGNVKRGVTTGYNKFFVLEQATKDEYNITKTYLKNLVPDNVHSGILNNNSVKKYLLNVDGSKGELDKTEDGKKVLKYIIDAEKTTITPKGKDKKSVYINKLTSVKNHSPYWYSLNLRDAPAMLLGIFADKKMKMYENKGGFYSTNNYAGFTLSDKQFTGAAMAYLCSSWFSLYMEKNGHSHGGGALQFLTGDYKSAPIPDFKEIKPQSEEMAQAWKDYANDFDQEKLDGIVLDKLGFAPDEQCKIKKELQEMVNKRTNSKKDNLDKLRKYRKTHRRKF